MKRRYWLMENADHYPIIYGAFGPQSAACYAEAHSLRILPESFPAGYLAEMVAVREMRAKFTGKNPLICRQKLFH